LPVPRGLLVLTIVLLPIALLLMVLLPLVDQEKSKVRW
jgi:competence protein ComGC